MQRINQRVEDLERDVRHVVFGPPPPDPEQDDKELRNFIESAKKLEPAEFKPNPPSLDTREQGEGLCPTCGGYFEGEEILRCVCKRDQATTEKVITSHEKAMDDAKALWVVKSHSYPIADTGDYDGYYELTNGKIHIFTKDDWEDEFPLQKVADAMNEVGCRFYLDDPTEFLYYHEKSLREQLEKDLAGSQQALSNAISQNESLTEERDRWSENYKKNIGEYDVRIQALEKERDEYMATITKFIDWQKGGGQ